MDGSIVFNVPSHEGKCAIPWRHIGTTWQIRLNVCFFDSPLTRVHDINGKSIGSAVFAQLMAESPYTLQWAPLSPKLPLPMGGSWTPIQFLWPIEPTTQMASRSVQPFLQSSLVWQTDSPRYSVGNNRMHLCTLYCNACGLIIILKCQIHINLSVFDPFHANFFYNIKCA